MFSFFQFFPGHMPFFHSFLSHSVLSGPVSSHLVLTCPLLSGLVLSFLVLSCPLLSSIVPYFLIKSCHVSSCLVISRHVSSFLVMSHAVSSCLVMSIHVSSCIILSRPVLSCSFRLVSLKLSLAIYLAVWFRTSFMFDNWYVMNEWIRSSCMYVYFWTKHCQNNQLMKHAIAN